MRKSDSRMIAPDVIKILACIFVVVIHHKSFKWPSYVSEYLVLHAVLLVLCLAIGIFCFLREKKHGKTFGCAFSKGMIPIFVFCGFLVFKKFPVTVFILLSSYFMGRYFLKPGNSIRTWYKADNVIPRILRFYIPFVPVFVLCILYKIFVLRYDYTPLEVVARFILGGFKPGSYYVPILAQLVLVFPLVGAFVVRHKAKAVGVMVFVTFLYDYFTAKFGMNDIAYKFIVFRFTAHIAFGVYASVTDFKISRKAGLVMFCIGVVYSCLCIYTNVYNPPMFYQWQETSFVTLFYIYPVICLVMNHYRESYYTESRFSSFIKLFAASTYHIFLVQLMFYTTFGFALNERIGNYCINIVLNLVVTIAPGMLYAYYSLPFENRLVSKVKKKLSGIND